MASNLTPSQDQVVAQIRLLIPILGGLVSIIGWASADKVGPVVSYLLQATGPVAYLCTVVWSGFANSRASIMASAAKPVAPGVPAPQIVLPVQEAVLAQSLPNNVNTTETKRVVSQ